MRKFFAVTIATSVAALIPTLAVTYLLFGRNDKNSSSVLYAAFVIGLIVSLLHVLFLGLPIAGWLLRVGKFRLLPMLISGGIIGMVPAAIWALLNGDKGFDNGSPLLPSWIDYLQVIGYAGALGAIGAIAFYFVYKCVSPDRPKPLRDSA